MACSNNMNRHQRRRTQALGGLPGPGSTPEQLAERLRFLSCNEMAIQLVLSKVRAEGQDIDLVALVIDARDSLGRKIAREVDPDQKVEKVAGPNMIPTVLMLMPRRSAYLGLRDSHPTVASVLTHPAPAGLVAVACVAAEGITLVHLPIVAMAPSASA